MVPVFDFGRDDNGLFLVMEWIDGSDLASLLGAVRARGTTFPPVLATHVAAEIAKALSYAHDRTDTTGRPAGILHRDVTPGNILVSRQGEVRLTDFGIASAAGALSSVAGTPAYMSPEAARGGPTDARSDLYSLGLVFAEMLLGRPLRLNADLEAARSAVALPSFSDLPGPIAAIVSKLIAPDPADRFASALAVQNALMVLVAAETVRAGESPAERLARLVAEVVPGQESGVGRPSFETQAAETVGTQVPAAAPGPRPRRLARSLLVSAIVAVAIGSGGWRLWTAIAHRPQPGPRVQLPAREAPVASKPVVLEPAVETQLVKPARLKIRAPGSWVTVFLDGRKLGDDAGEFLISPGRHVLRVENPPLHFAREQTITVRAGETLSLEFRPVL